jgi:competence protein ComEC
MSPRRQRATAILATLGAGAATFLVAFGTALGAVMLLASPAWPQQPAFCRGADSLGVRLSFLDVGQGSSTLLSVDDGHVLIDAGRSASLASELLFARGVRRVNLLVATHNHADHIGGMAQLISAFEVGNLLENGYSATTGTYGDLVAAASGADVRVLAATARTLNVGRLALRVLPPAPRAAASAGAAVDQNEHSLGIVAEYGAFRAVFSGDAGARTLAHWLATDSVPRATVVLAGHHGSADATTPEWVDATSPALVVVPVGGSNAYGHPSPRALALWTAPERLILRTDWHGTVEVRGCLDGTFSVETEREAAR